MRLFTASSFVTAILLCFTTPLMAATIVDEDFESYADTTALNAVWSGGLGTLDNSLAFSGSQSARHPGGTVNAYFPGIGTVDASATEDVLLTARIYDDGQGPADRMTVGLRGDPFPLFEMGRYNSPSFYAIRASLFNNDINPSWVDFKDGGGVSVQPVEGWHTYEARFSLTGLTVTLDLQSDGSVDSTIFLAGDGNTYGGFTSLRFGGPSNLSSSGPGYFDDIRLETVTPIPEPSSLALGGIFVAGIVLLARRRG